MFKGPFICLVIWLWLLQGLNTACFAQTCVTQSSADKVCVGSTVHFVCNTSGGTAVSFAWNFGDGFSGTKDTASHAYITPGNYIPSLKVMFASGDSCISVLPLIRVFALPVAKFVITTSDTMCFKGNELCIIDQSVPGPSSAPVVKRTFQLSNGYARTDQYPYAASICYRDMVDMALGHLFSLVLEVSDTNNCVSRLLKKDSVLLYKKIKVDFTAQYDPSCYHTPVTFVNTSSVLPAEVKKFYWVFGDGAIDSVSWTGLVHNYTSTGASLPYLVVTNIDNCTDTSFLDRSISSIFPDSTIYFSRPPMQCWHGNYFRFASHNDPFYTKTTWTYYEGYPTVLTGSGYGDTASEVNYPTCGRFRLRMMCEFPNCITVTDTFVTLYGPKAVIENDTVKAINRNQCEVHDTVYFITPNPYLSCQSGNSSMIHLWNFNDPYAPPCTTDTKYGTNIGMNCNFSRDTFDVKHFYTPGKDDCYKVSLYMEDPGLGCVDSTAISVPLTSPSAHPDSISTPIRRGLYYIGRSCIGDPIQFVYDETLPSCGAEKYWINFDSACGKNNWIPMDTLQKIKQVTYVYGSTCDSVDGYITLGLIVKNGKDKLGHDCYDTAWYHHMLQMRPIIPFIDLSLSSACEPYEVIAALEDSIQHDVSKARWEYFFKKYYKIADIGGGFSFVYRSTSPVWQYLTPPDSIVHAQPFTYPQSGVFGVSVVITNKLGCSRIDETSIGLGCFVDFEVPRNILCVNDTISLHDYIRYYNAKSFNGLDARSYWSEPARAAANKEQVWWDIGDGKGFAYTGSHPVVSYKKPGKYTISMMIQDSAGCRDTIVKPDLLNVTDAQAKIGTLQASYFCAPQIVIFKDSSLVFDSVGATTPSLYDDIRTWSWDFGDAKPLSLLQHPAHNYTTNGVFNPILTITTAKGCIARDTAQLQIKGPLPSFSIADTLGCAPFSTVFKNTTGKQLNSWTWYFGDPANHTYTTTRDTDVFFTYFRPGIYDVKMLGIEDVLNTSTGNVIICPAFFPDTVTGLPVRKVYVLGVPPISILAEDTICMNAPLLLTVQGDPLYTGFSWAFGDGLSAQTSRPDTTVTHSYDRSGRFNILLKPAAASGYRCLDSAAASVYVADVKAGFDIDMHTTPVSLFQFNNTSKFASRYIWDFGRPDKGAINRSTLTDGSFDYGKDTGTFIICLMAFNAQDCMDSVCKAIRLSRLDTRVIIPNVFTPDNNDDKNDAFDIDILGFIRYELVIYNRWGTEVYLSDKDGIGNDNINWNGKDHNVGQPCAEGVYFFIFTYQLITEENPRTVHGTITLIRDK